MSHDPKVVPALNAVRGSLGELRSGVDRCEEFFLHQFDQVDAWRRTLIEREHELMHRQTTLEADERQLEEQWQRVEELRQLAERGVKQAQDEARRLAAARQELAAQRAAAAESVEAPKCDASATSADRGDDEIERQTLERALTDARAQIAQLAPAALQVAAARRELAQARRQIMRQQQRIMAAKGYFTAGSQAREQLQAELESARGQIRELQDRAARDQRQAVAERTTWAIELQRLRSAVERHAELLGDRVDPDTLAPTEPPSADGLSAESGDLDALVSQLAGLQSELAQRAPATRGGRTTKRKSP